jgi:hypothetical protein
LAFKARNKESAEADAPVLAVGGKSGAVNLKSKMKHQITLKAAIPHRGRHDGPANIRCETIARAGSWISSMACNQRDRKEDWGATADENCFKRFRE